MTSHPYYIRNYQPADFDEYVRLNIEAEKLEPTGRWLSPPAIRGNLGRPGHTPEQDLFVVEAAGSIVGYMDVTPEIAIGRVILDCWLHPEHRRRGLAIELLGYALRRATELGAKVAHVNVVEGNEVAKIVLSKLGFKLVRRFLELRLDMARVNWLDIDPAALECCHLQRGEEDKLTRIQNRSFAGTWGYNPNTVETITYRINLANGCLEDVVVTCDGDRVIGYCWTEVANAGESAAGNQQGRIYMIGTDPDYRGRGVGKRVLLAGLTHLKSKGLRVAELTVDSQNEVACALYQSIGFEVRTSALWYEKSLD